MSSEMNNILIHNIKILIETHNINSWAELARRCGINIPAMQRIMNGKLQLKTLKTLQLIADYFSIKMDDLITEHPNFQNQPKKYPGNSHSLPILDDKMIIKWVDYPTQREDDYDRTITIDKATSEKAFAYKLFSDEYAPLFPQGTCLIVDQIKRKNGDYLLIATKSDRRLFIREYQQDIEKEYIKPLTPGYSHQKIIELSENYMVLGTITQAIIDYR